MAHPAPDPVKLLDAWMEWEKGEALPGRVMSNLKTGGLRILLEDLAATAATAASLAAAGTLEDGELPEAVSADSWTPVV